MAVPPTSSPSTSPKCAPRPISDILATAATRYTVADSVFNVDPTAYLDLRASYDWTPNWQLYGAVDNLLNIPPALVPGYSGSIQSNGGPIHSVTNYDLLGREVRAGVRFNF